MENYHEYVIEPKQNQISLITVLYINKSQHNNISYNHNNDKNLKLLMLRNLSAELF